MSINIDPHPPSPPALLLIGLRILPVMFISAIQQRERITVRVANLHIPIVLVLVLDFVRKVRSKGRYF